MFPGELAQSVIPLETRFARPYNIPITWCDPPAHAGDIFRAYSLMLGQPEEPGTYITFNDMKAMGLVMFDGSRLLLDVAQNLSGSTNVSEVRGWQIQEGKKAIILQWEITIDGNQYHAVQYVSKGDHGTRLDQEAKTDYANLQMMYDRTQHLLTEEGGEFFSVTQPIAGDYVVYNDTQFFTYFMPFAEGYGELQVDSFGTTQLPEATLWFRYALAYDGTMQDMNETQAGLGPMQAMRNMEEIFRSYGIHVNPGRPILQRQQDKLNRSITSIMASLHDKPSIQRLARQRFDVETALALIYVLSDGRMPIDFGINRGDFMVQFLEDSAHVADPNNSTIDLFPQTDAGLKLHLISVNGGLTRRMQQLEWVQWMRLHEESVARNIAPDPYDIKFAIEALEHGYPVKPFAHESSDQLIAALHRAQSLIT